MTTPEDLIGRLHLHNPVAEQLGIELISASASRVELHMTVGDRHLGFNEVCHGAMLFALADIAMSYVSNAANEQAVATHAAIDFVAAVHAGDRVEAVGVELNRRGRAAICDVTMTVADTVVATFRGNTLRVGGAVTEPL